MSSQSKPPLAGKTALITGSTSGIGLGIARALAAEGARIVLNGFGEAAMIAALQKDMATEFGVAVDYHGADMTKPDEIAAMIGFAELQCGGVDILVNNAGIQHVAPIEDFPIAKWDAIIAINLSSSFHTMHCAMPGMRQRNWGRIINIASAHGMVASPQKVAYVTAKHGLIGMTKTVALETARTGITCNAICPGWVLTPLVQRQIDDRAARNGTSVESERLALLGEKQPSLEFVTPEQIGGLAVFLCSPAANEVRGVAWNIDGGWVAQ